MFQNRFQVDNILVFEELDIPGNLLHLLDDIGARINLNGSNDTMTVRDNIALVVADAQPNMPVKGLFVAARPVSDLFTNDTFTIVRGKSVTNISQPLHNFCCLLLCRK